MKKYLKKLRKKTEQLKVSLNRKLDDLKRVTLTLIKYTFKCLVTITKCVALGIFIALCSFYSGILHSSYIENRVGRNTVYIQSPKGALLQGSATGFEVKAPSGKVYTLTNAHVCGLGKDGIVMIEDKKFSGRLIPKRIIEVYQNNDLCLVEGLQGYEGLTIANNADIGDLVWAIGYPLGQGLNISTGRIKDYGNLLVMDQETPIAECTGPYKHVEKLDFIIMTEDICVVQRYSQNTDVATFPGNSGSPLVNVYGNVVGVVFASDNTTHWGATVPLLDINKLLKPY